MELQKCCDLDVNMTLIQCIKINSLCEGCISEIKCEKFIVDPGNSNSMKTNIKMNSLMVLEHFI